MYKLLKKFSLTDVAEIVHKLTGNKNKVYKWLLDIQKNKHIFIIATLMLIFKLWMLTIWNISKWWGNYHGCSRGDRSLGSVVDDATIKVNIAARFLNAGNNLFVILIQVCWKEGFC